MFLMLALFGPAYFESRMKTGAEFAQAEKMLVYMLPYAWWLALLTLIVAIGLEVMQRWGILDEVMDMVDGAGS